ncbi:MAG: hypothetical protein IJV48_06140 [Ruminococcus sp.]|nr:hypothetical protein [Ruminococcus sp.]
MYKKIRFVLQILLLSLILLLCFSACSVKEMLYCDHCHRTKFDTPHYIMVGTVDTTVCSDCYKDYQNGEWTFP